MPRPMYDENLPSEHPLQWVERKTQVSDFQIVSFGAYNAKGLIGPEMGGCAIAFFRPGTDEKPAIIGMKTIGNNMPQREVEHNAVLKWMQENIDEADKKTSGKALQTFLRERLWSLKW